MKSVTGSVHEHLKPRNSAVGDVLSRVKISGVFHALTGIEPRRTGPDQYRGRAAWRDGDNPAAISLDDRKNVWHDHVDSAGGGVLALVARIRQCSNQDALRWLAAYSGIDLDDKPLSCEERAQWAQQHRHVERLLPKARYWRRIAIIMTATVLDAAKASIFDPTPGAPRAELSELPALTRQLARLERLDEADLVEEFTWWMERYPEITSAMVHSGAVRAAADRRALEAYLGMTAEANAA